MRARVTARWLVLAAIAIATWIVSLPALAAPNVAPRRAGRIVLSRPEGARGPLVLAPGEGGWIGTIVVTNVGAEPLSVSRVSIFGDTDDVRSPARVSVRFADGASTSATIPPGASRSVTVSWMPDRDPRVRQAFGHVIVTSTDEEAGEVAMGFRAQVPTGIGWIGEHALSLLVLLPLVVVAAAAAARASGRRDDAIVGRAALGASAVQAAIALWVYQRFVPDVTRADGNDGFQFVERAVWIRSIGAEWYLGVDGTSVALLLLAALAGLAGAIVAEPGGDARHAARALLASGVMAALVALDLVVLFAAWQLVLLSLVMLVGASGRGGPRAAAKLGVHGAIGSAAMLAAFLALARASGRAFLVDGTPVAHALSIPEIARASFAAAPPIAGLPFPQAVWVMLFVAVAVATPVVPLHTWLPDAIAEAPAEVAVWIAGVVVSLGPYLLARVGFAALPEGSRWAGASVAAFGAIGFAYGAACAMAQSDLRRFVGYATIAGAGATLLGLGALTPEGIEGALASAFAHGLAAVILLVVAGAARARAAACDLAALGGLAKRAPVLGSMLAVGLATSLGAPVLAGFWGVLLPALGAFPRHPVLVVFFAASLVLSAAAHLRVARAILATGAEGAPFAHDATSRELAAIAPAAVLAVVLGVWPAPLLSQLGASAREASVAVDPAGPDSR